MTANIFQNVWSLLMARNLGDIDVASDMKCIICKSLLVNAHTSCCGCRYCLECLRTYLNGERKICPGNIQDDCKLEMLDIDRNVYPDHPMNQRISKLVLSCRYSCGYRCELRNIEEHERTCEKQPVNCPYVNAGCTEVPLVKDKVDEHLANENESHAKLLMGYIDVLHDEIRSMRRDTIELQLEMRAMREMRKVNETNEMVDQLREEMANLRNEIKLTRNENISLRAEMAKHRTEYLGLVAATDLQLSEIRIQGHVHEEDIELLRDKYRRGKGNLNEVERQARDAKEELWINIEKVREELMKGCDDMAKRVSEIETNVEMQNGGEFVWCIDEWVAKRESARNGSCEMIFSDAFYTHKNGYKMCLAVCPDGHSTGKGTHLSIYFHLMRGPFDNILSWPFKYAVTISLIDQHARINHVSRTYTFDEGPKSIALKKPSAERNTGRGASQFIELASLPRNSRLCQDDRIFIRCVVK